MIGEVVVFGLPVLAATLYVLPPLLGREAHVSPAGARSRRRAELEARRDETYAALKEADLDRQTGKLDEADHRLLRESLLAEAAETLQELDALEKAPEPAPGRPSAPGAVEEEVPGR
jgi:hypothetical protein